jgi:DNA (cytosine-5)-methyltransferase 1
MKGVSLFSSAGIGEYYFKEIGIDIVVSNELIRSRAGFYSYLYPQNKMILGDIRDKDVKEKIKKEISKDVKFLIATPPCQGLSSLGKNKMQKHFEKDDRNYLIFEIFEIIDYGNFDYILIENVPKFLEMYFPYNGKAYKLVEIIADRYSKNYEIESKVLDAKDYGVPQTRPRAVIKMYKKGLSWEWPEKQKEISLKDVIGHLPSLRPGEKSSLSNHYTKKVNDRITLALMHTPSGKSAFQNDIHYPKKENGERIKGFHNTYKRMVWDKPCHARTTYNGSVSSHNNVHPGKKLKDGTYSDPRVLTLRETFIVSSLPESLEIPKNYSETFMRTIIGEGVPPLFLKEVIKPISKNDI